MKVLKHKETTILKGKNGNRSQDMHFSFPFRYIIFPPIYVPCIKKKCGKKPHQNKKRKSTKEEGIKS